MAIGFNVVQDVPRGRLLLAFPVALMACSSANEPTVMTDASTIDAADDVLADGTMQDTWTNYAEGFIQTYCVRCHSPGGDGYRGGELDFTTYAGVAANKDEIRCGVAATRPDGCSGFPPPQQFPIAAPYPSDAERDRFVAWIEAGAPE